MALFFNIRRTTAFAVVTLLLLAVVAPLCLMPASPALGMSMTPTPAPTPDCDRDVGGGGSMAACPYANPDEATSVASSPDLGQAHYAAGAVNGLPGATETGSLALTEGTHGVTSPALLTPLRL